MRSLTIVLFAGFVMLVSSISDVSAGCPDEVKCKQEYLSITGQASWQTIGTIKTRTCFKFPVGCRPWHCDGVKDRGWLENHAYWQKKCDETFPECKKDHAHQTEDYCMPHFVTY